MVTFSIQASSLDGQLECKNKINSESIDDDDLGLDSDSEKQEDINKNKLNKSSNRNKTPPSKEESEKVERKSGSSRTRISPPATKERSKSPVSIHSRLSPIPDVDQSPPRRKGQRPSPDSNKSPMTDLRRRLESKRDSSPSPVLDLRRKLEKRGLYHRSVTANDEKMSELKRRERNKREALREARRDHKRRRLGHRNEISSLQPISSDSSSNERERLTNTVFHMTGFSPRHLSTESIRPFDPDTKRTIIVDQRFVSYLASFS